MAKPALGRGLGALLGESPIAKPPVTGPTSTTVPGAALATDAREQVQRVTLDRIRPCPFQPRKDFSPEALRELADSIKEQGIVQPLIVRERNGHLELIAGERRWRAAQLLGLAEVPVILRQADDRAVLELALIENLQRENLNPLEEAQGYASPSASRPTVNFIPSILALATDILRRSPPLVPDQGQSGQTGPARSHQARRRGCERRLDRAGQFPRRVRSQLHRDPGRRTLRRVDEVDIQRVISQRMSRMVEVDADLAQPEPPAGTLAAASRLDVLGGVRAHG